jgi:hypothetical protein
MNKISKILIMMLLIVEWLLASPISPQSPETEYIHRLGFLYSLKITLVRKLSTGIKRKKQTSNLTLKKFVIETSFRK